MKPLLKWAGAKRWHVPTVERLYAAQTREGLRRVVELFAGSAAISFALAPLRCHLNDANPHLINFYREVQARLDFDGFDLSSSESLYYDYRAILNKRIREGACADRRCAQLFYYLNHHGFNGLFRVNKRGEYNVPFAAGRSAHAFDADEYRNLFTCGWTLSNDDFADVLLEPDDFVYADPPYDSVFTDYTEDGWTRDRSEELATMLRFHPGPVILMNSGTPFILELYQDLGYTVTLVESGQRMQQSRGRTDVIPEVMATNFGVDFADGAPMIEVADEAPV